MKLEEPSAQELTPSDSRSDLASRPWTPPESTKDALHFASESGHEDLARTLLSNGGDVNAKSKLSIRGTEVERKFNAGRAPLHWAAVGGHEGVVRMLLDHDAVVTLQNATGRSALQGAIWQSHDSIAWLLVEKGSRIADSDKERWTPLHEASCRGRLEIIKVLIAKGKRRGDYPAMLDAVTIGSSQWGHIYVSNFLLSHNIS